MPPEISHVYYNFSYIQILFSSIQTVIRNLIRVIITIVLLAATSLAASIFLEITKTL